LRDQGDATPIAERRLVSVLFADLVGFTTRSEAADPEDVRELLSKYFDVCRRLIERYGGVVEKFIGDAVMAVWGAPVANEDDAERAVRAALELTAAVTALGEEANAPGLRARAGVLTGEAAVTLGAKGQGLVAGDLVNTASRIQSVADPGAVLVGEVTRRASEAAIVYEDAGTHELKGKAESVPLWRAVRVVGLLGGVMKTAGLEPPFVGRDRELRLIKELFHATADESKANLVSVVGVAGIGKSRLSWEFEKYIDGLAVDTWWHRGRCLAYGEGVAFWALAEMVRGRAGIVEDEDVRSASEKLRGAIEEHLQDPGERRFVEPRLAQLLGLEDRGPGDQQNLFSAWRLFFERMSETYPIVLVFEDIHWADSALLDFVEYLLEWSRDRPIFILTLARPELMERRPSWGAVKRMFTSLFLEPLAPEAMERLLTGPVPGLPDDLRTQILSRAEGVPFYAVETVRMLLDRGLIVRDGDVYRTTGPIETLEVPETLQALIAARLDGLPSEERALLQEASVLGKTFTIAGVVAMAPMDEVELERLLTSLVRKEVLSISADPLSPERGQYGFVQDLVKKVAYDTMSRRERKTRHLAAAAHLASVGDEDEMAEVIAAHLLDAYQAAPEDPDASEIRARALAASQRAGERASSLGAAAEAQRHFGLAAQLTDDPLQQADLMERAGLAARAGGRAEEATELYERAISLFEDHGATHPAARVSARLGDVLWDRGRFGDALARMDRSFEVLAGDEPDEDLAALAAQLGRFLFFRGDVGSAASRIEVALEIAEAQGLPEILSQAINTKSMILTARGRRREALALLRYALDVALEHEIPTAALRAHFNLADSAIQRDAYEEAKQHVTAGLAMARRVGHRQWELQMLGQLYPMVSLGEWDEVEEIMSAMPQELMPENRIAFNGFLASVPAVRVHRGQLAEARAAHEIFSDAGLSDDIQERATWAAGEATIARAEGRLEDALELAEQALATREELGFGHEAMKDAFVEAAEAALALGKLERVEEIVATIEDVPQGAHSPFLDAQALRFRGALARIRGADDVESRLKAATGMFREMAAPFWMAVAEVELGEWLIGQDRSDEATPVLDEARAIFERLGAAPWLERVERGSPTRAVRL
jgi:class 3 adenylate cyclase/tetratricopeptide (TPR) repeat protein